MWVLSLPCMKADSITVLGLIDAVVASGML
jgi:hypothetical protein